MKKYFAIILIFIPLIISAHQYKEFIFVYGNVTVRFRTGLNYEEINNAKIIGQYAALLSDSLNYNEPIFLDFIHNYGNDYQGSSYSYLNFGSDQYKNISHYKKIYEPFESDFAIETIPVSEYKEDTIHFFKEEYTIDGIDQFDKIVLRQFGFHFDITETMNLISFAIMNKSQLSNLSLEDTLSSSIEGSYDIFNTIPKNLIDSIKRATIEIVEKVLQSRIYQDLDQINNNPSFSFTGNIIFFDCSFFYGSYFSQHGKMMPFACIDGNEIILDTLNQIFSIDILYNRNNIVFVFETPNTMRMYRDFHSSDIEFTKSRIQTISTDPFDGISTIDVKSLDYDLFLISLIRGFDFSPSKKFLYLSEDDLIIDSFDSYIDSYRKKESDK